VLAEKELIRKATKFCYLDRPTVTELLTDQYFGDLFKDAHMNSELEDSEELMNDVKEILCDQLQILSASVKDIIDNDVNKAVQDVYRYFRDIVEPPPAMDPWSISDNDIQRLKIRHGCNFCSLASQAEAWIAIRSHENLDRLKHAAETNKDKYSASLLVMRDDLEKSMAEGSCSA